MFERVLTVKYLTLKNSFIYLPSPLTYFKIGSCVQLIYGENQVAYFSVTTQTVKLDENTIGINSLYAKALGIKEDELIIISEISPLPTINSITISPLNNFEYEVLEMLADNIQSTLLEQIRVVNVGQKLVIWAGANLNVTVYLDDVKPVSPGMIDFLTEVVIQPKSENRDNQKSVAYNSIFNMEKFKSLTSFFNNEDMIFKETEKVSLLKFKDPLICRLAPLKELPFLEHFKKHLKPFNVFMSQRCVPMGWVKHNTLTTPTICSMSLLTTDIFSEKLIYVRLYVFEDFPVDFDLNFGQNLFVDHVIFKAFECDLGVRIIMKDIEKIPLVNEISIHTRKPYSTNIQEKFKIYLADNADDIFILNSDILMDIGENIKCSLKFSSGESKFCVVDDMLLRNCKYVVNADLTSSNKSAVTKVSNCDKYVDNVSNFKNIINSIESNFSFGENHWENFLITGKPGTGKSTLLKKMADKLKSYPNFIYTETIYCKTIKGKTMDSLFKVFSTAFSQVVLFQPSVLILDDLHILCEHVSGDESSPNSIYFNRISEMLHSFLKIFSKYDKIAICATSESCSKLNTNIYSARGSHLFKNLYSINDFLKVDRKELLKHFFMDNKLVDVDFDDLAIQTEGFVIQDIVDFYNKTLFEAYKDQDSDSVVIHLENKHFEKALKNTCVLALQNVQLNLAGDKTFSDIGGLHDVKKILIESLLWPAQYPGIFEKAPLRLQSGLLLYGPPGTGKTMLAAAAAKHCGLRLISIKGPELLSKYIGASEQAVRDVFQKAQGAKPCILFFDEFDSLAPRRGHDNTGVTDRVVNQLLTQLDGVESLSGVCVLAATSRPDLLDPALLRPGRLDRQILCPLPNEKERLEILVALSKSLDLSSDVNLQTVASLTDGYSGADLQAVLYTAQLSTIDNLLDNSKDSLHQIPEISQKHLEDAISKTRPSLSSQEKQKYDRIYTKFEGATDVEDFRPGTKATLA